MTLKRDWIASPNHSSRSASVRLIVIHTAEGARTYKDLGAFFGSSSSGVSSHVGIDDTPGRIGEYVKRDYAAWTQAAFNSQSVSVELCAFAAWSEAEWERHPEMLKSCGLWIREEAERYGLPITRLSAKEAQGSGRGVCGHVDLGSAGGGHHDPGSSFPWGRVLDIARGDADTSAPAPLLARISAHSGAIGGIVPDYLIADNSKSEGAGSKYAVYGSGLVRQLGPDEFQHLRDEEGLKVISNEQNEAGTRLLNVDRALRGLVKERK